MYTYVRTYLWDRRCEKNMEDLWRTSRRDIVKGVDFTVLQIRCDDLIESDHVGERSTLHFRNIHDEIPILRSTLMIKCYTLCFHDYILKYKGDKKIIKEINLSVLIKSFHEFIYKLFFMFLDIFI